MNELSCCEKLKMTKVKSVFNKLRKAGVIEPLDPNVPAFDFTYIKKKV